MTEKHLTLWGVVAKTAVVHTVTYFLVGIVAFSLFNYTEQLATGELASYLRPASDPLVMAGVLFQPLRGALFGFVFYLLREVLFRRKNGWLITWAMLVIVGIISTFAPASGSIEGLIYMKSGLNFFSGGILEVFTQSFLLAFITCYWVNHSEKQWLTAVLGILLLIAMLLPTLGLLAG